MVNGGENGCGGAGKKEIWHGDAVAIEDKVLGGLELGQITAAGSDLKTTGN